MDCQSERLIAAAHSQVVSVQTGGHKLEIHQVSLDRQPRRCES